jgi:beta-N-acetylhexosaminidase
LTNGFPRFPPNEEIGKTGDLALAYTLGDTIGKELASVGITMNFAPVVDVNTNPDNPVIGDRSFGSDAQLVAAMARQVVDGHHAHGIATVLKHFPGHGDTNVNSHLGLPTVNKEEAELQSVDLLPFHCLADQADAIMTAHILVPAIDPDHPATCSSRILKGLLRDTWCYEGVIISDSLVMRGVVPKQSDINEACEGVSRAAIDAFKAGCDCLILGSLEWADFTPTHEQDLQLIEYVIASFRQAVLSGEITTERLDASVTRILALKRKFGIPV